MKGKIFLIASAILVVLLVVLIWWPMPKTEDAEQKEILKPVNELTEDNPLSVDWDEVSDKGYTTAEALAVEPQNPAINEKMAIKNRLEAMGKAGGFYSFDDNRSSFEYGHEILKRSGIEEGDKTASDIEESFLKLMEELNIAVGTEIKIESTDYKMLLSPWWVSAGIKEADAVEILANYYYNGLPIKMFSGFMIKADYFTNGQLIKMENRLPFARIKNKSEKRLRTIEELKATNADNFVIWRIDGGQDYELSGETAKIDTVKVKDYNLGYIYDIKSQVAWPYYFVYGESELPTGTAGITMIISATKE